jgi:hypothetical protein
MVPTRLEIVRFGEVIRAVGESTNSDSALELEFDLEAGWGCWLAARAVASDGSGAHTTPIYLTRDSQRTWNFDQVPALIDRRVRDLDEIEQLVDRARASRSGGPRAGALTGAFYGNVDFTRPRGTDALEIPRHVWPPLAARGGAWSARYRGVMTIPMGTPGSFRLHLDSSGASTFSIDGREILSKEGPGEVSASIALEPESPQEVSVTYSSMHPPRSYFSLDWSADGIARQPVPAEWFTHREADLAAFRFADGTRLETEQLVEQADALLERVENARQYYRELRAEWSREQPLRSANPSP